MTLGLNGLQGFNVTDVKINVSAPAGQPNLLGYAYIPNPSLMTIAMVTYTPSAAYKYKLITVSGQRNSHSLNCYRWRCRQFHNRQYDPRTRQQHTPYVWHCQSNRCSLQFGQVWLC
jgi:hypothetical protein